MALYNFVTDDITDRWTMTVAYDASDYNVCLLLLLIFCVIKVLMGRILECLSWVRGKKSFLEVYLMRCVSLSLDLVQNIGKCTTSLDDLKCILPNK